MLRYFAVAVVFVALAPRQSPGMGQETFGNAPVSEQPEWKKGVLAVVNGSTRLYSQWINGNESFFFLGRTDALNGALERFSKIEDEVREVVFLPGPGEARTFDDVRLPTDFQLMVPSGIYLFQANKEAGTEVFVRHATLTVYVTPGRIELDKVRIPKGVRVLDQGDLVERYSKGVASKDPEVKRYATHLLGEARKADESREPGAGERRAIREQIARFRKRQISS